MRRISSASYYGVYHGHNVDHLECVFRNVVQPQRDAGADVRVIWLAGDSSLDNKYWLDGDGSRVPAMNGMERVLDPPTSVADIATHLNAIAVASRSSSSAVATQPPHYVCLNCSVEESTIGVRQRGKSLLPQDLFLQQHLQRGDVVVVSLGGNDIALKPRPSTICSMGWLTSCSSTANITKGSAWGLGTLQSLIVGDYTAFLGTLVAPLRPTTTTTTTTTTSIPPLATTSTTTTTSHPSGAAAATTPLNDKKSVVLPCVIYYPDENANAKSWANVTLGAIGYNKKPGVVQSIIDRVAAVASEKMTPEAIGLDPRATHVEVVALSKALDGKRTSDYVARVEPSVSGGRRMAELIWDKIQTAAR